MIDQMFILIILLIQLYLKLKQPKLQNLILFQLIIHLDFQDVIKLEWIKIGMR